MPVQFIKPQPNPATQERVDEVVHALTNAFRSLAPAVQRAGMEMGRSFRAAGQRPA